MLTLNGKPLNHYPWRTMERGDLLLIAGQEAARWTRSTLYYEARKARPDLRPWCISPRPEGIYVAVPSIDNPTPIPRRPKKVKPVDPVKARRAERRAWHARHIGRPAVTVPLAKAQREPAWTKYPLATLEVGESFTLPDRTRACSLTACASLCGRATRKRFEVRPDGDGLRCTRLPDPAYNPFD